MNPLRTSFIALMVALCLPGCQALKPTHAKPDGAQEARSTGDSRFRPGTKPTYVAILDPKSLIGRSQAETEQILGAPHATRKQSPATIWQYSADGCTLELFFYMDLNSRSFRALAFDAKLEAPEGGQEAIARCVGQVRDQERERRG